MKIPPVGSNPATAAKKFPEVTIRECVVKKSDVICPDCCAGYRRIELESSNGQAGRYKCLVCSRVLEVFDGSREIAYRLTVQPSDLHPEPR